MQRSNQLFATLFILIFFCSGHYLHAQVSKKQPLMISGVYPHLALFNDRSSGLCVGGTSGDGGEGGIGAIVPWAGQLWMVTYSPHCPNGSSDKLYSIDKKLTLAIHPESIGGTPANRMIHKESNQLIIGSYLIDSTGRVRTIPLTVMPGRMTATARHLTDPANKVYFYDMEGKVYEVNVHSLQVNKLFNKPVPGWHGKGAYTAQNRFIVANNGEEAVFQIKPGELKAGALPRNKEEMGVLASWDGKDWSIIERKQFTDVTGPGGIYGSPDDKAPAWSIGWDKRSVILKLLDGGNWYTYRLPKATHTYDHRGGWYTEWPRIREVGNDKMLMDMHGMFYDFPKTFTLANSHGISAMATHLRYIPDFCNWNGQLVLATDETTMLQNPAAGRSQSNLWFGTLNDLNTWGTAAGWGGPWLNDSVKAGVPSDAFLVHGFNNIVLHLMHHASVPVEFTLEIDKSGNNHWEKFKAVTVGKEGYEWILLPAGFQADWMRVKTNTNCKATAYFYEKVIQLERKRDAMFNALADADDQHPFNANLIRPAAHNKNLQVLPMQQQKNGYREVDETLHFFSPEADSSSVMNRLLKVQKTLDTDNASVIVTDATGTFRLPRGVAAYDQPFDGMWPRTKRELESERFMLNIHGTFYEVGRESGYAAMRPVTTHNRKIMDFCTWRGLLVLSGTRKNAERNDGHYFSSDDQQNGLWFGAIDDLWKLGKPVGEGGVWKHTEVKASEPSLPYLMTGYDKKTVFLQADKDVFIKLEVNIDLDGWHTFRTIQVPAGGKVEYQFPEGYQAHWIRATTDKDCIATVWFKYE